MIAEQVGILENDIQKLYENWFIETCDQWVVPYIGDLLDATLLQSGAPGMVNSRSFVANTISYRRKKGTVNVLAQLARDITGWYAKAVEFFELLEDTQYVNHLRPLNFRTPDVRRTERLELLNTPFDTIAHTVEVRNIEEGRGYYNIPNIGIFLWRLKAYPVYDAPAFKVDNADRNFTFSSIGLDTQLFTHPSTVEIGLAHSPKQTELPTPISRLGLYCNTADYYVDMTSGDKSIKIKVKGITRWIEGIVPLEDIVVCELSDWQHRVPDGKVAVDPKLGRIAFSSVDDPKAGDVLVTHYYGFSERVRRWVLRQEWFIRLRR